MKAILLHGDHSLDSYHRLQKLIQVARERDWEVIKVGLKDNLSLPEKLTASNLFEGERLYVIENLGKIKKTDLDWFRKNIDRLSGTTIIYHDKAITNNLLKLIPKKVIENEAPEFVFNLLSRHLRDLCWVTLDKDSLSCPGWRVSKLSQQAKRFPEGKIKKLIKMFAEIDIKAKTSKANIIDSLDFIIASELE
jgi:DNA polymerase III delta subunit